MNEITSLSGRSAREVALQAAGEAGEVLMRQFRGPLTVTRKGRGRRNIVTDVDVLSEKTIIGVLRKEFPDFGVLSEESGDLAGSSPLTWIVDPLDGTNNYLFGIPFFCITIALVRGRDVLLGVVYEPVRGEFFVAEKGRGAYLDGKPVSVSRKTSLQDAILGYDIGYNPRRGREMLDTVCDLWPGVYGLRAMGSAALSIAYVGCGRLDLYFHRFLYPWDIAASMVFVSEGGGRVTDWSGRTAGPRNRQIIASNEALRTEFLGRVGQKR